MPALPTDLRNKLERAIIAARDVAEAGARAALEALAVHNHEPYPHQKPEQRKLRNHLRAHARQLGDTQNAKGELRIDRLVHECAYEHWHRMLFARFLAENDLLIEPDSGMAISLGEAEQLAKVAAASSRSSDQRQDAAATDLWTYASRCAQQMLPQIFRPDDPLLQVGLANEHRVKLERLLAGLDPATFKADDSLGWVYQFWQSAEKDRVNASGKKITGDTLPAVTQLFTEHYMVLFLLHNTIGAWHAGKVAAASSRWSSCATEADCRKLCALPGVDWEYLRFVKVAEASSLSSGNQNQRQDAAATSTVAVGYFDPDDPVANLTGDLPHWRQPGVTYFVTFRCADALPQEKLQQWQGELEQWRREHPEPHDAATCREFYERFPARLQHWLDAGYGECPFQDPANLYIVASAMRFFDGQHYQLLDFVVSANHVHALVTPLAGHELSSILHSWKSFTANKINERRGKTGTFWQKESFDHIVRSPASLERFKAYIDGHRVAEASTVAAASSRVTDQRQDASATWRPAAGTFEGWPKTAALLKMLDPCCGSGHFLVAGFELLVRLRMAEEGMDLAHAVDAVLRDNIHGLELDARCTQIAAFNLAMAAWKLMEAEASSLGITSGWKPLPPLHIACTGIAPQATVEQWLKLAEPAIARASSRDRDPLRLALRGLHGLFADAPTLGSLIDPNPASMIGAADWETVEPYLASAMQAEADDEEHERAVAAAGIATAASILSGSGFQPLSSTQDQRQDAAATSGYTLVITNVPYLGRGKQDPILQAWAEEHQPDAKADLATMFVSRAMNWLAKGGTLSVVGPQNWLFLTTYKHLRVRLLKDVTWDMIARLGPKGFQTPMYDFNIALKVLTRGEPTADHVMAGLDASPGKTPAEKAALLSGRGFQPLSSEQDQRQDASATLSELRLLPQAGQRKNPDAAINLDQSENATYVRDYAGSFQGLTTADDPRLKRQFWEVLDNLRWRRFQGPCQGKGVFGGREDVVDDQLISGALRMGAMRGREAWGRRGVAIDRMGSLAVAHYEGDYYHSLIPVLIPKKPELLEAIAAFAFSDEMRAGARGTNQALSIDNGYFEKIPFDLAHWQQVAAEKYPAGLPEPESDDPTQWLFHGWPGGKVAEPSRLCFENQRLEAAASDQRQDASATLQVAVARLLGYRWPAELDDKMRLSKRARDLVAKAESLLKFADDDGIVCIPSVRGEEPAADRLLTLLGACGSGILPLVQSAAGSRSHRDLDEWLRNDFFKEHCELFHQRPFVWHIWDGRKRDGFHALLNYHKLCGSGSGFQPLKSEAGSLSHNSTAAGSRSHDGRKLLESLTYSYVGEWISRQQDGVKSGAGGAEDRLAAATELQKRLVAILEGEPPFDIFVRWKPLREQPIGWEPDINDGVRMNIRPFLADDLPNGRAGAGVLRWKPNIKWDKDRGKEPERKKAEFPWFWGWDERSVDFMGGKEFKGERFNDCHYTVAAKRAARQDQTQ